MRGNRGMEGEERTRGDMARWKDRVEGRRGEEGASSTIVGGESREEERQERGAGKGGVASLLCSPSRP